MSNISCVSGCVRNRYFKNWPTHQTIGSPWSRMRRTAKSSGIASGKCDVRGFRESIIGKSMIWVFCWWPDHVACVEPSAVVHVSESGLNTSSCKGEKSTCIFKYATVSVIFVPNVFFWLACFNAQSIISKYFRRPVKETYSNDEFFLNHRASVAVNRRKLYGY